MHPLNLNYFPIEKNVCIHPLYIVTMVTVIVGKVINYVYFDPVASHD